MSKSFEYRPDHVVAFNHQKRIGIGNADWCLHNGDIKILKNIAGKWSVTIPGKSHPQYLTANKIALEPVHPIIYIVVICGYKFYNKTPIIKHHLACHA